MLKDTDTDTDTLLRCLLLYDKVLEGVRFDKGKKSNEPTLLTYLRVFVLLTSLSGVHI